MAEDLDPEKYHVLTPKKKKLVVFFLLFLFLFFIPLMSLIYYKSAVHRPSQTAKEANFEIGSGDDVFEIAQMLYEKEAINSEFLFIFYVFLKRSDTNIQAGTYKIPAGTSLVTLVDMLKNGRNDISLTFLEGWRLEQFAIYASQKLKNFNYQDFMEIAKPYEGYLFPDTYFFNLDAEEEEVFNKLRDTFDKKTASILKGEDLDKVGLSKQEAVIFASMVEREVSNPEDAPVVAGILIKRWREGMKLDVDATTQYSVVYKRLCGGDGSDTPCIPTLEDVYDVDWWPHNLTREELDTENPYNTRAVVGLPPTPISSFSLSSLSAVINYEKTPYYYYLTGKDGVMRYAVSLREHEQNISNYLSN